jgi:superfamily I DNA/RNA helicase
MTDFLDRVSNVAPIFFQKRIPGIKLENESNTREGAITVSTVHSAKGLQHKAIIIVFADQFCLYEDEADNIRERALLYVGMTRAEDLLVISSTGPMIFADELTRAIDRLLQE